VPLCVVETLFSIVFAKLTPSVEWARTMSNALLGFVALACSQMTSIAPLDSAAICGKVGFAPDVLKIGGFGHLAFFGPQNVPGVCGSVERVKYTTS